MGMDEMSEATQGGAVFENTGDNSVFITCIDMARRSGINPTHYDEVIIFLGKEIDRYRDKINSLKNSIEKQNAELMNLRGFRDSVNSHYGFAQLEAVQDNAAGEIIKALADNGYNTITINCYKDIESEV